MITETARPTIRFPEGFDAQAEFEMPYRGYLSDVVVQLEGGLSYRVSFTDLARLEQTLADDARAGRPFHAEPGLIVLPELTPEAIQAAVSGLWRDGYFAALKPVAEAVPHPSRLIEEAHALLGRAIGLVHQHEGGSPA